MKILAIDIGMTMGWAYRDPTTFTSGIWKFEMAAKDTSHKGNRYVTLWRHLESFKAVRGMPTHVVYERPGNLFGHARKVLPAMQGIIELWALLNKAALLDYLASEVKKHACKGTANKDEMIKAAAIRWPDLKFKTHDQCDAVWLLSYMISKLDRDDLNF